MHLRHLRPRSEDADERGAAAGSVQPLCPHEARRRMDDPRLRGGLRPRLHAAAILQRRRRRRRRIASARTTIPRPISSRSCSRWRWARWSQLKVFGTDYPTPDGTCIRDYVHTTDLASAHWLAIQATTPATREVFNIGTGDGNSVMEVIKACEEVTGRRIPLEIGPRRPGDAPASWRIRRSSPASSDGRSSSRTFATSSQPRGSGTRAIRRATRIGRRHWRPLAEWSVQPSRIDGAAARSI